MTQRVEFKSVSFDPTYGKVFVDLGDAVYSKDGDQSLVDAVTAYGSVNLDKWDYFWSAAEDAAEEASDRAASLHTAYIV